MRKKPIALFILLLLLLAALPGCRHRSPGPEPPPPPVCGNHACEAGETPANCATDCQTQTQPVCNSNGTCDAGETTANCPDDCKPSPEPAPKPIDHSRLVCVGVYVGMTGELDFDWDAAMKAIHDSGFYNCMAVHNLSPWNNITYDNKSAAMRVSGVGAEESGIPAIKSLDFTKISTSTLALRPSAKPAGHARYAWAWNGTKYDVDKWDEEFWAGQERMLRAARKWNVVPRVTLYDQYGGSDWSDFRGYNFPFYPLRENVNKCDIVTTKAQPLYVNWKRQDISKPGSFYWLQWDEKKIGNEEVVTSAAPVNHCGAGVVNYVARFANLAAKIRDEKNGYQPLYLYYSVSNEPRAMVTSVSGKQYETDPSRSMEQDGRVQKYFYDLFLKAGFKSGPYFREINQDFALYEGEPCVTCMKGSHDWLKARGKLYEIHGICSTADQDKFLAAGFDGNVVLWSSDGCDEKTYAYITQLQALEKRHPKQVDYKLGAYWLEFQKPPIKYRLDDMNWNFSTFFPYAMRIRNQEK